jgi:hypothetical protein
MVAPGLAYNSEMDTNMSLINSLDQQFPIEKCRIDINQINKDYEKKYWDKRLNSDNFYLFLTDPTDEYIPRYILKKIAEKIINRCLPFQVSYYLRNKKNDFPLYNYDTSQKAWYNLFFLKTPYWKACSFARKEKDNFNCAVHGPNCNNTTGLNAHHINYETCCLEHISLDYLTTTCRACHELIQKYYNGTYNIMDFLISRPQLFSLSKLDMFSNKDIYDSADWEEKINFIFRINSYEDKNIVLFD